MDQVDIAWMAGIIEGEGSFGFRGNKGYPAIRVAMADEDVVKRLRDITGCGQVVAKLPRRVGHKPMFHWDIQKKRDVARLLLAIYPLMGERRQAKIAELVDAFGSYRGRDEPTCRQCGANEWYIRDVGSRQCRPCGRRHVKNYRDRKAVA